MSGILVDEESWNVCISGYGVPKAYTVPISKTVGQIEEIWSTDCEIQGRWILKKGFNSPRLEEGKMLKEVGETEEGSKTVLLFVEKIEEAREDSITLNLKMFGDSSERIQPVDVKISRKPDEAHEQIKEKFQLPPERIFRLRTEDAPLRYDMTFDEQNVTNCSIYVELGYEIEVKDTWSKDVVKHLLYSTDLLEDVLPADNNYQQRLLLGCHRLDLSKRLMESLQPHALQLTHFRVHLESQRRVSVHLNGTFNDYFVWPYDKLSKIVRRLPSSIKLKYEGKQVFSEDSFKSMGLADNGLICECLAVAVRYSSGLRRAVWVPKLGTVADLTEEVKKTEVDGDFVLKCGRHVLQPEDAVNNKAIPFKFVEVERVENVFTVRFPDRSVRWASRKGDIRFRQFGYEVLQRAQLEWIDVADLEFRCDGCGRQIRRSEEEHQLLPAACCHARSLHLTVYTPLIKKDAVTHGVAEMSMRTKVTGERRPVEDRSYQTVVSDVVDMMEGATQTEPGVGGQSASTQHPPPPEPQPFRIINLTYTGPIPREKGENVFLTLPPEPTVGELRTAVSRLLERRPEETLISRLIGVSRGVRVVLAVSDDGRAIFTTEDGRRTGPWNDGQHRDREYLHDDTAMFVLPPGRRLRIRAENRPFDTKQEVKNP